MTNILLRDDSDNIVYKVEYGVGEIECKKEDYNLLADSLGPKLNQSLKKMIAYSYDERGDLIKDEKGRIHDEGTVVFFEDTTSGEVYTSCTTDPVRQNTNDKLLGTAPMRCMIAGDLAFYLLLLGMEGHERSAYNSR